MFNYQKDSSDQLLEQIQEKVNSLELFSLKEKLTLLWQHIIKILLTKD